MVARHDMPGKVASFYRFGTKTWPDLYSSTRIQCPRYFGMPLPNDGLRILRRAGVQLLAWIGLLLLVRSVLIVLHLSAK